jgi:hypothetical protein
MIMWPSPELNFISDVLGLSLKPNHSHIEVHSLPFGDHVNWDEVIPLVNHHRVGGLLFYWIRKLKFESRLPRDVCRDLERVSQHVVTIWEDHRRILKRILRQFRESETEVILLKGAQLGHTEYPHFTLRPIEDIDLLIRRPDRSRVIKFMLAMGFNLYETNQTCDKFFIRKKQAGKPIFIEIHSNLQTPIRLNRSFNIDIDKFWKDTQEMNSNGFSFLQLCPTHNLIYLAAHLSHHHFSRLIWAYDVALLIQRHGEEIDWEKLEELCVRMRIRSPLYHGLRLCRELFGISIPEKVLRNLSPPRWRKKIGHFVIRRNLLFPEQYQAGWFGQFLIKTFLVDSWLQAILWFLFPTREWIKQEYSVQTTNKIYPYYFLHPILYLIKAMRAPVR